MRKYQQKQIIELLGTVREAQEAALYEDCQQGAIVVGEFIEAIEGEGTQTVALLEEYCELVYKANNDELNPMELRRQFVLIENSVRTELQPNKIEMAFLSYKASMSDSIESIYLAAKDDPACDAYWIPIPYYDKNPDGSFGAMHFEDAECYSDIIECTDWQLYDIEARHPDAIFTFNPYDHENYVSSVHPEFYCERLRELTDCLVYVPYFVAPSDKVLDLYCIVYGCKFAHKIILQSEAMREYYIQIFTEDFGDYFGDANEKFVALGSPKLDKIINSKREDYKLPDEWAELIGAANGGRKKIILYNTTINAMVTGYEQYLKKVRSVVETFRGRDDVVLWWRPHPLIKTAFTAMRAQFLQEYEQIVADFVNGNWGIYDDTPDLHRAIALSDVYYGDFSSLVAMYQVTGKPIVLQNVEDTGDALALCFTDFTVDDDGKIWGFELRYDGLFQFDLESNIAEYVVRSGSIPRYQGKQYLHTVSRYMRIASNNGKVFCLPQHLDNIFIYNQLSKETTVLPLDCSQLVAQETDVFFLSLVVSYRDKLYSFSGYVKAIVVFDTLKHSVSYQTDIYKRIGPTYTHAYDKKDYAKTPIYISEPSEDGIVSVIFRDTQDLMSYCLPTQGASVIASNPILAKCILADFDGQNFWMITERYDKLVKWNPSDNNVTEYIIDKADNNIPDKNGALAGISDCGDNLLLFPGYGNALLSFDKHKEQFSEYTKMPVPEDELNTIWKYDRPKCVGDKVYAFARFNQTVYELDLTEDTITEHVIRISEHSYENFIDDYLNAFFGDEGKECADNTYPRTDRHDIDRILRLVNPATFDEQVNHLVQIHKTSELVLNTDGTSGTATYQYIKDNVL